MNFTKMHGLGNDYVYVNCFEEQVDNPSDLAIRVSDRHTGIGSDGLILIMPSETADVRMRMFNADGSEAQMCGNGIRCVAKYTYDHQLVPAGDEFSIPGHFMFEASYRIETERGILTVGLEIDDDQTVRRVCVNMGQPILTPIQIPVNLPCERVVNEPIDILGQHFEMTCVSMGNPHVVFFTEHVWAVELERLGPIIEHLDIFPQRTNVHFVKIDDTNELTMRTWERGSGVTMACGTGACATAVAGVLNGKCARQVIAHLPGGSLELYWSEDDNCVYMTGPAVEVYHGKLLL